MASQPVAPVGDFRSAAVEYQRDREHKQKWAHGSTFGCSRREADGNVRPWRPSQRAEAVDRRYMQKDHHKSKIARKQPFIRGDQFQRVDAVLDEEMSSALPGPEPDAEVNYSFDATHGPSHGSQILSAALSQAVERFENKVTDKLVKDEYDVLNGTDINEEDERVGTCSTGPESGDDDFEFV